ncbi:MAG: cytochrome b/b6 domain-containing protein [Dehalococcoidales bacterium]|nr:cytochrome b/b6 domain-containing protein [Dehalococcoidales bacterium]
MANSDVQQKRHPLVFLILLRLTLVSVLFLIVTGFYIHYPIISNGGGFLMSLMRGVHFFAAGILTISVALRVILMFIGKNRDWSSFLPSFSDVALVPKVVCHYMHLCDMPKISKKYNPLQMMTYTAVFLLAILQIFFGFALMYPDGWLAWLNYGIFGTEVNTRIAHYIINWVFVLFLIVHTYLAIRDSFADTKEVFMVKGEED